MTIDDFATASPEFEPNGIKDEEELIEEDAFPEEEFAVEESELEKSILETIEGEEQKTGVNSLRLYLGEISRFPLLTADEEKALARSVEIGKRIREVKSKLGKRCIEVTATAFYLKIIDELGQSKEIIQKVQEHLGLPNKTSFRQIIMDEKFRSAVDGIIDPVILQSINDELNLPTTQPAEQQLVMLSVDCALIPEKVLAAIPSKASLTDISDLVDDVEFIYQLESYEIDLKKHLDRMEGESKTARDHFINANMRLVVSIARKYIGHGLPLMVLIQEGNMGLMQATDNFNLHKGFRFSTYATYWIRQKIGIAVGGKASPIRLPPEKLKTSAKISKITPELRQELGREPSCKEIGEKLGIPAKEVREIKSALMPASLEKAVGGDEEDGEGDKDSQVGDFIEDINAPSPQDVAFQGLLKKQFKEIMSNLTDRERRVLQLRYGLEDGISRTQEEVGQELDIPAEQVQLMETKVRRKLRKICQSRKLNDYLG